MKSVGLTARAEDDLRAARDWYEERTPGLGSRFVSSVDRALARIADGPERYSVVHGDIRRSLVRRFPFGIFYIDTPEAIRVIAVVHLRRSPAVWKRRQ